MKKPESLTLKYLVIGDSGVGKTSLLMRYCEDAFESDLLSTVGIDFKIKKLQLDGKEICLNIWDTAGQERFRNITKSFYKNAQGIVLAYAIDNHASFMHIENWVEQIKENGGSEVSVVLVANKSDLTEMRQVSRKDGEDLANKYGMKFAEVSAKGSKNIQTIFEQLTREVLQKQPAKVSLDKAILSDSANQKSKAKKQCC